MSAGKVIVYGGKGALGAACVSHFRSRNWWVGSVDLAKNENADVSIIVPSDNSWGDQETHVVNKLNEILNGEKLDAIICVAGGWAGGNAKKDLSKTAELMAKQSILTSTISASIAAQFLKEGGVLTLTGATPALKDTPGMIGYGLAKAAVHQLTKSLAGNNSGLPKDSLVVAILPVTLDTPMNRKWMPDGDFSTWTPLSFIAELFEKWAKGNERPKSGSLLKIITENSITALESAN